MISALRPPLRMRRVGATRRSPTPALAGTGNRMGALTSAAAATALENRFISTIPTLLHFGVIAVYVRNG
jgi:hypothetical protein